MEGNNGLKWICINDKEPENGELYIVTSEDQCGGTTMQIMAYRDGRWRYNQTWYDKEAGICKNHIIDWEEETGNKISFYMYLPDWPTIDQFDKYYDAEVLYD